MKNLIKYIDKYHLALVFFLLFYLLFTFFTYKLVPITSDEEFRYNRGKEQLTFFRESAPLQNYFLPSIEPDSYYFYVTLLNIFNQNFYYEWFHLQNMLFGLIIFIAAYFLLYEYSKNPTFSVLAPIFLFLTPSFSGHLGLNPIDMPFAILFTLNIYLIYKFRDQGFSFKKILTLGFSFWLLLGLRPLGFQIFLIYFIFVFLQLPQTNKVSYILDETKNLILIGFVSIFLLTISWPYLGINFFKNFLNILIVNSSYNKWNNLLLYNGEFLNNSDRPWNYLFTYLSYKIPVFIFIFGFLSLINTKNLLKKILISTLGLNIILYLVIQPVIYNGMRHYLFIVPFIVILACFGFYDFLEMNLNKYLKYSIYVLSTVSVLYTIYYIIILFPNQYSFFNEISGGVEKNIYLYETDYWGGTYRQASEYIRDNIVKTDNPYDIKVYSCNLSYSMDYFSHKKFIMTLNKKEADYTVCDAPEDKRRKYNGEIIKSINLGNEPFVIIRKNILKN